jgi:flagellar protein FliO/FliZ
MFETLFGSGIPLALRFFIAFLVVLGLIGIIAWLVRRFGANRIGSGATRGRQPRLAVIDATSVDGRRRLVLVRRDNTEHLLMIGGPTDVVVEANIIRAAGTRDVSRPGESAAARGVNAVENTWPIQPLNEPGAPTLGRAPRPNAVDEPWLAPEPGARPRPVDGVADLPTRVETDLSVPSRAEAAVRTSALHSSRSNNPTLDENDQTNLAEMALQLEAALRRSPAPQAPAGKTSSEDRSTPSGRQSEPFARSTSSVSFEAKKDMLSRATSEIEPAPEQRLNKTGFKSGMNPVGKAEPHFESSSLQGKKVYDSLEEEMANLLGRPSNKT